MPTAVPSHDPTGPRSLNPGPAPSPGPQARGCRRQTRLSTGGPLIASDKARQPVGSSVPGAPAPFCAHDSFNRSSTLGVIWEKQSTADEFVCLVGSEDGNVTAFQNTTSGWVKISDNWFGATLIEDDIMNNNYLQNNDDSVAKRTIVLVCVMQAPLTTSMQFHQAFCIRLRQRRPHGLYCGHEVWNTTSSRAQAGRRLRNHQHRLLRCILHEVRRMGRQLGEHGAHRPISHAAPYCHDWDSDGNLDCLVDTDGKVALILNAGRHFTGYRLRR